MKPPVLQKASSKVTKKAAPQPTSANAVSQQIAARAYAIWQRHGCLHGRDQQDWFQAEQELLEAFRK